MQIYICCPHHNCGSFQYSLNWLKSFGIEPTLEHDGEHHFFEFSIPEEWDLQKKIDFNWQLTERTIGRPFCICGRWLDENLQATVSEVPCPRCGRFYLFCKECDAMNHWEGCDCIKLST